MTPEIKQLETANIAHRVWRYDHTSVHSDYGIDASEQLGVPAERVFKTLVADTDRQEMLVAIVPVSGRLHMKSLAAAAGAKKTVMADGDRVQKATGYVLGGVSPLGQKKRLRAFIDHSAADHDTIYISGGRRGLEIELAAAALATLLGASFNALIQPD